MELNIDPEEILTFEEFEARYALKYRPFMPVTAFENDIAYGGIDTERNRTLDDLFLAYHEAGFCALMPDHNWNRFSLKELVEYFAYTDLKIYDRLTYMAGSLLCPEEDVHGGLYVLNTGSLHAPHDEAQKVARDMIKWAQDEIPNATVRHFLAKGHTRWLLRVTAEPDRVMFKLRWSDNLG